MTEDDLICVGAISGSFGVKGEVRLKSFCAIPEDIDRYGRLSTGDGAQKFDIKITRAVAGGFAARMTGITTKEAADALKGTQLFALRSAFPSLPDDEFYHADLIGLPVHDTGGVLLGAVRAVHNHGAGDLLEVYAAEQRNILLLPFTKACVPTVDLLARRIVADPPDELE